MQRLNSVVHHLSSLMLEQPLPAHLELLPHRSPLRLPLLQSLLELRVLIPLQPPLAPGKHRTGTRATRLCFHTVTLSRTCRSWPVPFLTTGL